MKNILLSGLGGSIFPYLHNLLEKEYNLFYVDADESLIDLYPTLQFFPAPFVKEESYIPFIIDLIKKHDIDVYIPLIDEEIEKAREIEEIFKTFGSLKGVRLPKKVTGSHRGFAFVDFHTKEEAKKAFEAMCHR